MSLLEEAAKIQAAPDPEPEPESKAGTEYVILARVDIATVETSQAWVRHSTVTAASAEAAIRHAAGETEGVFVAVPSRSWRPVQIAVTKKVELNPV